MKTNTLRGAEWQEFSKKVLSHIDTYTVPQYGDKEKDQIEKYWTIEACLLVMGKYLKRQGKNSREGQDKLDMLKVAHYACFIYNKLENLDSYSKGGE